VIVHVPIQSSQSSVASVAVHTHEIRDMLSDR
jgi:hypothetical protein